MPDVHSTDGGDSGEDGLCDDDDEGGDEEDEDGQPILRSSRIPAPAPPMKGAAHARLSAFSPPQSSSLSSVLKKKSCYERHKRPGVVLLCIIFIVLRESIDREREISKSKKSSKKIISCSTVIFA